MRLPVALLALLLTPPWSAWGQQDPERMREVRRQGDRELPGKYRPFRELLQAAYKEAERGGALYVFVGILDRAHVFPGDCELHTRMLILHKERADLDDYGFLTEGKRPVETTLGDSFFIDERGRVSAEAPQGRKSHLVVEWFVPTGPDTATLGYAGERLLSVRLAR